MTRNCTSSWNTVRGDSCSDCSPSRISSAKNSNNGVYPRSKFYSAQVFLALDALHQKNVIYREYSFPYLAWNQKMFCSTKRDISNWLTSDSPGLLTSRTRKQCPFAELPNTWLQKWSRSRDTINQWIGGAWAALFTRWWQGFLHSEAKTEWSYSNPSSTSHCRSLT